MLKDAEHSNWLPRENAYFYAMKNFQLAILKFVIQTKLKK